MNNDTALVLLLADMQREKEALRARVTELEAHETQVVATLRECENERDEWRRRHGEALASAQTSKDDSGSGRGSSPAASAPQSPSDPGSDL